MAVKRYGLLGLNGCGKSILLTAIGCRELPIPEHMDINHLSREIEATDMSALEAVINCDEGRLKLEKEAEALAAQDDGGGETLEWIYERLEALDAATVEKRAAKILHGLGFNKEMFTLKFLLMLYVYVLVVAFKSLTNTPYIIHQIFYHNQSLRVSNAAFSSTNNTNTPDSCISATHNLTLPPTSTFNFHQNNHKDIMLFFSCNLSSMPLELLDYRIGWSEATNKTDGLVLALYKDDVKTVSLVSKSCETGGEVVDAVVEESEGVGIEEKLRRGFMLN
ncbi:uncharacterized protein LOC130945469 [Arachis stenosperma]|uniref:uncharacterized protein LOC130945469 n=1 Tax=Arachis stenosperma TaxID=217475 RepID=UPI0025AC5F6B|nr:uncharacterized protein LOC130945469 [Arachis stenosperma]